MNHRRVLALLLALYAGTASAAGSQNGPASVDLGKQDKIVSIVVFADAMADTCEREHPPMRSEFAAALSSWQSRNIKYVVFAESDPRYHALKTQLLAEKPATPDGLVPEAQCTDMIRALRDPGHDIDSPPAQQGK